MKTSYSKIADEYGSLTNHINQLFFTDGETSIQEFLFHLGLKFCTDRPKFYTECESFWNYYIRQFYDRMQFILLTPTIRDEKRFDKAKHLLNTYNLSLELPDYLRQDIFIEYQTKIDEKLKPKKKTVQVAVKNKKIHLKEI